MTQPLASGKSARFDLNEIAKSFPPSADTLLLDTYLTNEDAASSRVFRVYRPTPPHYHATCDEYLYVLSGRGTFWMETAENGGTFGPGQLLSSGAAWCTHCRTSSKGRSSSCRSTRPAVIPAISSSSIRRTARRRASFVGFNPRG